MNSGSMTATLHMIGNQAQVFHGGPSGEMPLLMSLLKDAQTQTGYPNLLEELVDGFNLTLQLSLSGSSGPSQPVLRRPGLRHLELVLSRGDAISVLAEMERVFHEDAHKAFGANRVLRTTTPTQKWIDRSYVDVTIKGVA